MFWVYGKKFIQFDTYSVEDQEGGDNSVSAKDKMLARKNQKEIYPIYGEINCHYL